VFVRGVRTGNGGADNGGVGGAGDGGGGGGGGVNGGGVSNDRAKFVEMRGRGVVCSRSRPPTSVYGYMELVHDVDSLTRVESRTRLTSGRTSLQVHLPLDGSAATSDADEDDMEEHGAAALVRGIDPELNRRLHAAVFGDAPPSSSVVVDSRGIWEQRL
jgi:hypothetical protein